MHDRIERGEIVLEYLATEDMVADILTKPLQGALFRKMRALLLNEADRAGGVFGEVQALAQPGSRQGRK